MLPWLSKEEKNTHKSDYSSTGFNRIVQSFIRTQRQPPTLRIKDLCDRHNPVLSSDLYIASTEKYIDSITSLRFSIDRYEEQKPSLLFTVILKYG